MLERTSEKTDSRGKNGSHIEKHVLPSLESPLGLPHSARTRFYALLGRYLKLIAVQWNNVYFVCAKYLWASIKPDQCRGCSSLVRNDGVKRRKISIAGLCPRGS